jgi:hypothetical protein
MHALRQVCLVVCMIACACAHTMSQCTPYSEIGHPPPIQPWTPTIFPECPSKSTAVFEGDYTIHWPDGYSASFSTNKSGQGVSNRECCTGQAAAAEAYPEFNHGNGSSSGYWTGFAMNGVINCGTQHCGWPCSDKPYGNVTGGETENFTTFHSCSAPPVCNPDPLVVMSCGLFDWDNCYCVVPSPILIDLGSGFELTDAEGGVQFDVEGNGVPRQISWTAAGAQVGFLVLDRNANGVIDNGKELFGNFTAQPDPPEGILRNGFLALAVFDTPENGGNGDGAIDSQDAVFPQLKVWVDLNHSGTSESDELFELGSVGITKIGLDYKLSLRTDVYGNQFRYRAKAYGAQGFDVGRWAWDVIFQVKI